MKDKTMENYVRFICDEVKENIKEIYLNRPKTYGDKTIEYTPKIGPKLFQDIEVEIVETYTRSAKIRIKFDRYEDESIYYMSRKFGPEHILFQIESKMTDIVNNAFLDDNRIEEIAEKYFNAKTDQEIAINKFIKKIILNSNY